MEDYKNILNDNFLKKNPIIFKKYKPIKKIGCGSFGNIYSVIRLKDKSVFAMKKEKISQNNKSLESELYYSYTLQGGLGIPKLCAKNIVHQKLESIYSNKNDYGEISYFF